jgi:hypothetical protein
LFCDSLRLPRNLILDPDIWWHLADARLLLSHGFIRTEPYAFTVMGRAWVNPEWMSELPFWGGFHTFGLRGLYWVTASAIDLNVLGFYVLARQRGAGAMSSFSASVLGLALATVNCGPRTILLGYVCLIAEMWIIERWQSGERGVLWAMPALMLLWVNLHGSWAMGVAVYAIFTVSACIRLRPALRASEACDSAGRRQLILVGLLMIAALFVTPYGWHLAWNPFDMVLHQHLNIASAVEWRPLTLTTFRGKLVALLAVFLIGVNLWKPRRWSAFEIAIVIFGAYSGLEHERFCFLLAILATPSLAQEMQRTVFPEASASLKRPLLNISCLAAMLVIVANAIPTEAQFSYAYESSFPHGLIAKLQPGWRPLTAYSLGGYLAFSGRPEFIDSRMDTFEKHKVLANYLHIVRIENSLSLLDSYHVDYVLYPSPSPLLYLLSASGKWRLVGTQAGYELWHRAASCRAH